MIINPDPPLSRRPTLSLRRLRADMRRFAHEGSVREFLATQSPSALPLFDEGFIAGPGDHQVPPDEDAPWHTWLLLGGRGAGKTRAGAAWVTGLVGGLRGIAAQRVGRIALIGETLGGVRGGVIDGPARALAGAPPAERPPGEPAPPRLERAAGARAP